MDSWKGTWLLYSQTPFIFIYLKAFGKLQRATESNNIISQSPSRSQQIIFAILSTAGLRVVTQRCMCWLLMPEVNTLNGVVYLLFNLICPWGTPRLNDGKANIYFPFHSPSVFLTEVNRMIARTDVSKEIHVVNILALLDFISDGRNFPLCLHRCTLGRKFYGRSRLTCVPNFWMHTWQHFCTFLYLLFPLYLFIWDCKCLNWKSEN